jgi:hypothetical protein
MSRIPHSAGKLPKHMTALKIQKDTIPGAGGWDSIEAIPTQIARLTLPAITQALKKLTLSNKAVPEMIAETRIAISIASPD